MRVGLRYLRRRLGDGSIALRVFAAGALSNQAEH
jgi:hypothetical protein